MENFILIFLIHKHNVRYCKEVKVFDTVGRRYWTFTIEKWFDALKIEQLTETFYRSIHKKRKTIFDTIFKEANLWNFS